MQTKSLIQRMSPKNRILIAKNHNYLNNFLNIYSCVSNKRGVSNKHPVWDFALKKNKRPVLNKCPVLNSTQKIISVLYLINVLAR